MTTEANGAAPGAGDPGRRRPVRGAVTPSAAPPAGEPEPTYRELSRELDDIVERLEGPDVDIDEVSALFARAVELAQTLHDRLTRAETSVEELSARLARLPGADDRPARSGPSIASGRPVRAASGPGGSREVDGPGFGGEAREPDPGDLEASGWDVEDEPF